MKSKSFLDSDNIDASMKKNINEATVAEPLGEYIDRVHNGNKSAYARAIKKTPQHVRKMIDRGDIVIDGELYGKRGW